MNSFLIFFILGVFILGIVVLFLISRRKKVISEGAEGFVRNQWRMISHGANPKNDIIEADKLLDFVLGKYGFKGSLGEKLKKSKRLFSDIDGVWQAHKLRNKIAHQLNFTLSSKEVSVALASFKKAFIDLKIRF